MEAIGYVILHYNDFELTKNCIESIKKCHFEPSDFIIIVDNASTNDSYSYLSEAYQSDSQISLLHSDQNLGFAKGNNLGYRYAKEHCHADFMVIVNNDTVFEQKDFRDTMLSLYYEQHFHILGPDLITPSKIHQNPHRERMMTKHEVRKMLFIKRTFLTYFKWKKRFHIGNRIMFLEKMYEKRNQKTQASVRYQTAQSGIVPVGACIIFSPDYINLEEHAFYEETFMYGEEDILTYLAYQKHYLIYYSPKLQLLHLNGKSTKHEYKDLLDKNIFTYTYIVKGCKILLKLMKQQ